MLTTLAIVPATYVVPLTRALFEESSALSLFFYFEPQGAKYKSNYFFKQEFSSHGELGSKTGNNTGNKSRKLKWGTRCNWETNYHREFGCVKASGLEIAEFVIFKLKREV